MTKTILVLAANPRNTPPLRLDQEIREIDNGLQRAQKRDEFILRQKLAVRPIDVRRAVLDYKPNIVHFCGHGSGEEGIAFEDESGQAKLVGTDALSGFFELFAANVECVVLNACYSEVQADAIAKYIPYVVGMKRAIGDAAAIEFATAFYDALGAGESFAFAFKLACNAIQWANIPEHLTPVLKAKERVGTVVEDQPQSDPVKQILARSSIRLLHLGTPVEPPVIETHERVVTIGRAPKNMVIVADPEVSWEHGHIILRQEGYIYHHLSTSNPTIIRRKHEEYLLRPGKNEEVILRNQDRLIIGTSMFVVEFSLINEDVGYTTTRKKPEDADDQ